MRPHRSGCRSLTLWEGRGHRQLPFFATPFEDSERATLVSGLRATRDRFDHMEEHWRVKPLASGTRSELSLSLSLSKWLLA